MLTAKTFPVTLLIAVRFFSSSIASCLLQPSLELTNHAAYAFWRQQLLYYIEAAVGAPADAGATGFVNGVLPLCILDLGWMLLIIEMFADAFYMLSSPAVMASRTRAGRSGCSAT